MRVERSFKEIFGYIGDEVGITLISNQWSDERRKLHTESRGKKDKVIKLAGRSITGRK